MAPSNELRSAYDQCKRIALGHYENFPVGSLLIPKSLRPHFFALYAFMRTADDFADLPHRSAGERLQELHEWRLNLREIYEGARADHPIFIALQNTVRKFKLDPSLFHRLLDAFEFDARGNVQFETFDDLHWYTKRSAEPVGELVLALFGYRDTERIEASNRICTALQLINFMQDAKDDLANGRCYFPLEDLRRFGIARASDIAESDSASQLVAFECDRIQRLLDEGIILPRMLRGRLRLEIKAILAGADLMLSKIRKLGSGIFEKRSALSKTEEKLLIAKALLPF
jgi:hydroxysqualene synthase